MVAIAIVPVIVCLIGFVLFVSPVPPKWQRIGEIMFAVGLFFTVWALAGNTVRLT